MQIERVFVMFSFSAALFYNSFFRAEENAYLNVTHEDDGDADLIVEARGNMEGNQFSVPDAEVPIANGLDGIGKAHGGSSDLQRIVEGIGISCLRFASS